MTTAKSKSEILREAAQQVRQRGLCIDGIFVNEAGCVCTLGAIGVVLDPEGADRRLFIGSTFDSDDYYRVEPLIAAQLRSEGVEDQHPNMPSDFFLVTRWNDVDERTVEEVATLLERTADRADALTDVEGVQS